MNIDDLPKHLSGSEIRFLKYLERGDELSAEVISKKLSVDETYVYRLLRRLHNRGLIEHPRKSSVSKVALTPEGQQLIS